MKRNEDYPDFTGFIDALDRDGITEELISKLTARHAANRLHTKNLYERYKCYEDKVPIFGREPRFIDKDLEALGGKQLNNRLNHDFFGEINDVMIGYFAGKAAAYSYATDNDSLEETGGEDKVSEA